MLPPRPFRSDSDSVERSDLAVSLNGEEREMRRSVENGVRLTLNHLIVLIDQFHIGDLNERQINEKVLFSTILLDFLGSF